ncbi:MAG: flagellar hook-length control protein FliK, partial [Thermodesulfobacteriota bacterium]|nr:flagellar hook-length control protein FliK [Thermodesulfobacteriota bacterium]
LAGQEEVAEVDAEANPIAQVKQDGKQTGKVESEKENENGGQNQAPNQVSEDDFEDADAVIDVESLFQGLAFKEASSEEVVVGEFSLVVDEVPQAVVEVPRVVDEVPQAVVEVPRVAVEVPQVAVVEVPQVVAVENEGTDSGNPDRRSLFSGLLENRGDLSRQTVLSENMADSPPQDELLDEVEGRNDDSQNLFVSEPVVGEHVEGLESVGEAFVFEDETQRFLGPEGDSAANIHAAGGRAKNEDEIKHADDHELIEKSESSSILSAESNLISVPIEVVSEHESGADPEPAQIKVPVVSSGDVKQDQNQGGINQPSVVNSADLSGLTVDQSQKDGLEPPREVPSSRSNVSANVSANGSTVIDIPEDVQIRINNDLTASVAGAKPENRGVRLGRGRRDLSLSGSENGTVHLQGRARESQSMFVQGEQNMMNFSDVEIDAKTDAGVGEELYFSGASKDVLAEHFSLSTSAQAGAKEKSDIGHTFSRTDEMVVGNLEIEKAGLVKNSGDIISARSLPVSDENLLDQIQNGLTRQVKNQQTVTIKLQPESMGKIDVKLVLRDQQLVATFMVEQADVKDAMLRKMDSLRDGLAQRGIDVKDIDIKVTPPKPGDGPSVTVGDQHQDSADAWRQYQRDGFARSDSGFAGAGGGDSGGEDSIKVSENIPQEIASTLTGGDVPGSLHIMA